MAVWFNTEVAHITGEGVQFQCEGHIKDISEVYSFVSNIRYFFREADNSFQILEEYLSVACYSQCNSYEGDTVQV